MEANSKIVILDGTCGLCNKSVDILLKLDRQKQFKYTSLQGEFVKTLNIKSDIDSIVFYEEGKLYYKSTAILKILKSLGGPWIVTNIFYLIPTFLRDYLYDFIAKYRYKIFGKMDTCRMPKEGEKTLFLE